MKITRRKMLGWTSAAGVAASGLPGLGQGLGAARSNAVPSMPDLSGAQAKKKMKVVAVGAHVDDPLGACSGTMALYAGQGHEVVVISLTPGDSPPIAAHLGMAPKDLARSRREDAVEGCAILKAKEMFLNYVDENIRVDPNSYIEFAKILLDMNPDVVFALWPVGTHPDHRAASLLTYSAWLQSNLQFELYYYEVGLGTETQYFIPNHYVDVTAVAEQKKSSYAATVKTRARSDPSLISRWWAEFETVQRFRGMEHGCKYAEAFIHLNPRITCPTGRAHPYWFYGCKATET